jgi:WhiB family redox-sensing transcriptional regulator
VSHIQQINEAGKCVGSHEAWRFFSESIPDQQRAQQICADCPVRLACLQDAVSIGAEYGVWGGVIFWDGVAYLRRRGRGRPRKDDPAEPILLEHRELRELVRSA